MVRRFGLLQAALIGLLTLASVAGSAAREPVAPVAQGSAYAIKVIVPAAPGVASAVVTTLTEQASEQESFAFPADGSVVTTAAISASTSASSKQRVTARSGSEVIGLSLFAGEIVAETVTARVLASASTKRARAEFAGTRVVGLQVLGQPVAAAPGTTVPLADWGVLSVLAQNETPLTIRSLPGHRGAVMALHVHLLLDHGGLPAGSDIFIGSAEAIVQAGTPAPAEATAEPARERPSTARTRPRSDRPTRAPGLSIAPPRQNPPDVHPPLTAGGYVFPVYGPSSFIDSFGAPRATVSYHHGADIFAPLGAPLLAVADGTLFSVGWNDIGGLRLWLRDGAGNEFYYAHLSALSTRALSGAQVQAGDVIGFVGNTGDAQGTPYHLHFEIHPVSMLYLGYDGAVNPTRYLEAWERLQDVPITGVIGWAPPLGGSAPKPGAILLQASDISTASGLDPGSLRRAVSALPAASADGSFRPQVQVRVRVPSRPLDRG